MTRFYQLWTKLPRSRRKELVSFIHELKKLASANHECIVVERLGMREKDHVYVNLAKLTTTEQKAELMTKVRALGDKFKLPHENVRFSTNSFGEDVLRCYLYTDF